MISQIQIQVKVGLPTRFLNWEFKSDSFDGIYLCFGRIFRYQSRKSVSSNATGDVTDTSADTSSLEEWVDFKPNTSVQDGVRKFVDWYKGFYKI